MTSLLIILDSLYRIFRHSNAVLINKPQFCQRLGIIILS
ncbi:hypothetical protein NGUA11_01956 [Salmonella enterica]|nr:hypothetical protein NGUA11_01956 [Salmonella enterica]